MDEMFVVINHRGLPLTSCDNPWGDDQECLLDGTPETFSVLNLEEAKRMLKESKKVAKRGKLEFSWEIKKWKIVTLAEYLRENK